MRSTAAVPVSIAVMGALYCFYLLSTVEPGGILAPARLDRVFNEYALAVLEGRLDIPPTAIGLEGKFMNDGKVYTYYGVLPALLRIPLAPFLNLREVRFARVMVFVYCVGIGLICQWLILRLESTWRSRPNDQSRFWTYGALILVWFASPIVVLSGDAAQTYEPIALGLLLSVAFFAVIFDEVLVRGNQTPNRLILPAILAGLTVHARPNVAIALYFVTVMLCIVMWFKPTQGKSLLVYGPYRIGISALKRSIPVFAILFLFGASLMAMNYARWGSVAMSSPKARGEYGYFAFVEPESSPRRVSAKTHPLGTFSWRRVVPNGYMHLVGGEWRHEKLLDLFDAGYVSVSPPTAKTLFLWGPWYLGFALSLLRWRSVWKWLGPGKRQLILVSLMGCAIISYLILAYVTVTFRYKTELWPLLFFGSTLYFSWRMSTAPIARIGRHRLSSVGGPTMVLALAVVAVIYSFKMNRESAELSTWYRNGADPVKAQACVWNGSTGWPDGCKYLTR